MTRHGRIAMLAGGLAFLAVTATAGGWPEPDRRCSVRDLRGTYAWEMRGQSFDGRLSTQTLPGGFPMFEGTVFPMSVNGIMTVLGDGTATGSYSGLFGLVPLGYPTPMPLSATFTVNPDCTGVMRAPNGFGGTNTDVIVILDNGREVRTLGIDGAPFAWKFRMVRLPRAHAWAPTCGPQTGRGRYLMQCEGFEVQTPGPPPTYAGVSPMFVFDVGADGSLAGRLYTRGGSIDGEAATGTVAVAADCTSDLTIQTEGLPGLTMLGKGVYFDHGKEAFGGPMVVVAGQNVVPGVFAGFGCHLTRMSR